MFAHPAESELWNVQSVKKMEAKLDTNVGYCSFKSAGSGTAPQMKVMVTHRPLLELMKSIKDYSLDATREIARNLVKFAGPRNEEPAEVWAGPPRTFSLDLDSGFTEALDEMCSQCNSYMSHAAGQAHWQHSLVERHGGP